MQHVIATALWRVVLVLTVSKRKLADLAYRLDNTRRTL
jgi:hypothetical protein